MAGNARGLKVLLLLVIVFGTQAKNCTCPAKCKCNPSRTKVDCDRRDLIAIPKDIPVCVETLILSHNAFSTIENNAFPKLPHLRTLHMDVAQITNLEPHAFQGLTNLTKLFLLSNNIPNISASEFCQDLKNLEGLYIDRNIFNTIPDLGSCRKLQTLTMENNQIQSFKFPSSYSNLHDLKHLTLSLNNVKILRKNDFAALSNSKVSKLFMSRVSLHTIEEGVFHPLNKTLGSLRISYNPLNVTQLKPILKQLSKCKKLLSLELDGMDFNSDLEANIFADFKSIPLNSMSLSNNAISTIKAGTFTTLTRLRNLNLKNSKISTIEPTALKGLISLQLLSLSMNRLNDVPANLPPELTQLSMDRNSIARISNDAFSTQYKLQNLNLAGNNIQKLNTRAFGGLTRLQMLDLSGNSIDGIGKSTFSPLRRLEKLNLNKNKITKMINNIHVFEHLKNLKELDLSDNKCETLPFEVFQNLSSLVTLNLEKKLLRYMLKGDKYGGTFKGLENLKTLNLNNNEIVHLAPNIFRYLTNIQNLHLSKNRITVLDHQLLTYTQYIRKIDLSKNKISVIDQFSLGKNYSTFKSLNLEDNPFACTCELVWFCRWLNSTKVNIVKYKNYTCDSPKNLQGVKLINFDWRHLICYDYYPIIIAASVVGSIAFILILVMLLYHCRWRISLQCYRLRSKLKPSRAGYEPIPGEDLTYSAYISCIEQDKKFALDSIMNKLDVEENSRSEEGESDRAKYKLCFEPRDFDLGTHKIDNIVQAMEATPRAIIVLTNGYLKDTRHQMELRLLKETCLVRSFALIFVTYGEDGVDLKLLPKWVHNVYMKKQILVWNPDEAAQEEFYTKLDRKLRLPPPIRQDEDNTAEA